MCSPVAKRAFTVVRNECSRSAKYAAKVLKTTPEFWLNAQMAVDLWHAQQELKDERRRKSA
jgi:plasmid maintenance system antidote protein VapI